MKASVKLRPQSEDPHRNSFLPLLRLKLPISLLGFPFLTSASASAGPSPSDPSLQLRTLFPAGPSLRIAYHHPDPLSDRTASAFSLSLKCGLGLWGSPRGSPVTLSAHLPLLPDASPSFSLQVSVDFGDFAFKRSSPVSTFASHFFPEVGPDPNPKENGGGIYRPLPVGRREPRWGGDWIPVDSGMLLRTTVPVGTHAAVRMRWGVRLPSDAEGGVAGGGNMGRPFLTVDKISVQRVIRDNGAMLEGKDVDSVVKVPGMDAEAVKGAWFWIKKEADDLHREQVLIRQGIEDIRTRIRLGVAKKM